MKKLMTLLLVTISLSAFSQELVIRHNGIIYDNNDTIYAVPSILNSDNTYYIDIENTTSQILNILVLRNDIQLLHGATTQFCIGTACLTGNASEFPQVINAGENYSHATYGAQAFHILYNPNGNYGVSFLKFTLFDQTNPTISSAFYIRLDNTVSIQNNNLANALNAYPNPATDKVSIEHNLSSNTGKAELVIKNITGAVLYSSPINGTTKTDVSLENFSAGIYFYSIENQGKTIATKKLIVK
jgi:hypothetical protein